MKKTNNCFSHMHGMGMLPDSYRDALDAYGSSPDPPDECETKPCTLEPELWIKFEEPEEKVYYCSGHGNEHMSDSKAVDMGYL